MWRSGCNNAVVLGTGVDDSLVDFPPGTDALIRGTRGHPVGRPGRVPQLPDGLGRHRMGHRRRRGRPHRRHQPARRQAGRAAHSGRQRRLHARPVAGAVRRLDRLQGGVRQPRPAEASPSTSSTSPTWRTRRRPTSRCCGSPGRTCRRRFRWPTRRPASDDIVALIGYPAFDDRNDADDQAQVLPRPLQREALRARQGDAGAVSRRRAPARLHEPRRQLRLSADPAWTAARSSASTSPASTASPTALSASDA